MRYLDALAAGVIAVVRAGRPLVVVAAVDDPGAQEALKLVDVFLAATDDRLDETRPAQVR